MDFLFQIICNIFPHYIVAKNKIYKKTFYIIFSLLKFFLKGPFIINFKDFKFYSYPNKSDYSKFILTRGVMPDPREIGIIKKYIFNEKSIFIDCGANAGFYTIPIAISNPLSTVISFEPSNIELKKLKNNIKLNNLKNVVIEKFAISNKVQNVLFQETGKTNSNFSSGNGHIIDKTNDKKFEYKVKAINIDSYLKKIKIQPSTKIMIKIDLEGHDLKAIYGAKKTINKYKTLILFEFSKMIINDPSYCKIDFANFLKKNNLILLNLYNKKYTVNMLHYDLSKLDKNHDTIGNFVLLKKSELKKLKFF